MNMKQTIRTMSALLTMMVAMAVFACTFTACSDDENDNNDVTPILHPIAEHITGTWMMTNSYMLQDGEWVEDPLNGYVEDYVIRPDGTYIRCESSTLPDEQTFDYRRVHTWNVISEEDAIVKVGRWNHRIERLTADEIVWHCNHASDNGVSVEGEFKWILKRIEKPRATPYTRILGKWRFHKRYHDQGGEWVEVTEELPTDYWREYNEEGICITHFLRDGKEETTKFRCYYYAYPSWDMDYVNHVHSNYEQPNSFNAIWYADKNTLHFFHEDCINEEDPMVLLPGGHKDVFVREN